MTLAQLQALDAGGWFAPSFHGQHIPTLGQLLDLTRGRMHLFIEIKDGQDIELDIRDLLDARDQHDEVTLLSFYDEHLRASESVMPSIPAMWLVNSRPTDLEERTSRLDVELLGINHAAISDELIRQAHTAALRVFAWIVNDVDAAESLAALGVDGIITDMPDQVLAALEP